MRILVVDDDPITRTLLSESLISLGYDVKEAENGAEAWARVCQREIDLVITDWMMPQMSGLDLCRKIREESTSPYVYLILMSIRSDATEIVMAFDAGADEFLRKPVDPSELAARVRATDRLRRLHQDLRARNGRLVEAQHLRDNWTNMIVHDLRSPLAVIQGSCEFIQAFPERNHERRLSTSVRECSRVQALLEQMLVMAKSEAGALNVALTAVDISQFAEEAAESHREIARQKGAAIETQHASRGEAILDVALARRALDNLISNAIKYGGNPAQVIVGSSLVDGRVSFSVQDAGLGIASQDQSRLFERFATFESSSFDMQTGLGLSFCRMVAKAHGGKISYQPATPTGSIFTMSWPNDPEPCRVAATGRMVEESAG